MRRVVTSLLVVLLGLGPAMTASASPTPALSALSSLPAQSAAQLTARLKSAHQRTDAALKLRRERFDAWQSAVLARDEAAAKVERMKVARERGPDLETALRSALVLDEKANLARSRLMAAEAEVAKNGAELLRVYDAVLALKRREADVLSPRDPRRESALSTWQALSQQRDRVRRSLGPVLRDSGSLDVGTDVSIEARPEDDVETLLEKADLARDLEERFLRRAEAVERRIQELVEERAVARDVAGLVQSQSLFDEDDMRLRVVSAGVRGDSSLPSALPGGSSAERNDSLASPGGTVTTDGAGARGDAETAPAAPPPSEPSSGDAPQSEGVDADMGFVGDSDDGASVGGGGERSVGGLAPDIGSSTRARAAERGYTPRTANDVDIAAMLASGELTLPELRALQQKLRQRAAEMRAQSKELKEEVRERGAR